jgi:predicted RNA binding protein YcfA (HicA-like mRNA interferase family)
MKLPRNLSAQELIKRLRGIGYEPTRQTGSHVRLTRTYARANNRKAAG